MPLCCSSRSLSKAEAAEAEGRRARIVSVLPSQSTHNLPGSVPFRDPPPRYEEATTSNIPIIFTDEKRTHDIRRSEDVDQSDRSSMVSTPSTEVTGITMRQDGVILRRLRTGETGHTYSHDGSRPPSYLSVEMQSRGRRSVSPTSSDGRGRVGRDLVMVGGELRDWVEDIARDGSEVPQR